MQIEARKYGLWDLIRLPVQAGTGSAMLVALHSLLSGITPTLHVVVTARFIDTAIAVLQGSTEGRQIYSRLLAVVVLIAYTWISGAVAKLANLRLGLDLQERYHTAIMEKRARLHYRHVEDAETWDLISRVTKHPEGQLSGGFNLLLSMTALIFRILGVLGIFVSKVWWAAVVIISFSIPLFALAVKSGKASYEARKETEKFRRKSNYLSSILTSRETVDERSLFGYSDQINELWHERYETARKIEHRVRKKWFVRTKTSSLITALISILIVVVLLNPVLTGTLSVGLFMSLVGAAFGIVQMMSWGLIQSIDQLVKYREYLKDLTKFAMLEESDSAQQPPAEPPPEFRSLEFRNVSFQYPGTGKYVLKNLSFKMEAGKHYAFVGINGSGKTTITRLIAGLYDNYAGEILLNGKSIREWHPAKLKAMLSIVYQDFAKYYITVRDNIAIGDVNHMDGDSDWRINRAIDQVGLAAAVEKLPQGFNTPLGKIKADGRDISGGEWQRIAMARAIFNPTPLRILDEPTAALDPISESEMYQEFERMSRGKTTIFISHRLGSTKLADEIFVIGEGRVMERGSHRQLMALNGEYARMFESQRSWYD